MNINIYRHKLLRILSKQRSLASIDSSGKTVLGVSDNDLLNELNCQQTKLHEIVSELRNQKEVDFFDNNFIKGYFATDYGYASYTNKIYLRKYYSNILTTFKDGVQILVPLLSLIISVIAVSTTYKYSTEKNKEHNVIIENKIDSLNTRIEILEFNSDSLNKYNK